MEYQSLLLKIKQDLDSAQLLQALYETLYMVSIALFLGAVIGIPLGVLLVITRKQGIWPNIS
jgi:D-methionine transport system permease protein